MVLGKEGKCPMVETLEETRARIRALVSGPGKTSRWIARHLDYDDEDWCLIYPFAWEAGHYPKWKRTAGGHNYPVHRVMCEYRLGLAQDPTHHSAHSCGRGIQGCVNPMHVNWKTPSDNQIDRHQNGEGKRWKLTPEIVEQIKTLSADLTPGDIAKRFGVTVRNVRFILSGNGWTTGAPRIFTEREVIDIRASAGQITAGKLAEEYGSSRTAIDRIIQGRTYKWVAARAPNRDP